MEEHIEEVRAEFSNLHQKQDEFEELQKPRYVAGIAVYASFALQILGSIILFLLMAIFANNTAFIYTTEPAESALYSGTFNVNSIVILNKSLWDETYHDSYENMMVKIGEKDDYILLMNVYSKAFNEEQFQIIGNNIVIKEDVLNGILNNSITTWKSGANITLYVPIDDVPAFTNGAITTLKLTDKIKGMTSSLFDAISQVVVYLILTTTLILILKPSIKYDFELLKKVPKSDVFSQVGMGVLYIIAAGIIANIIGLTITSFANIPNDISRNQLALNQMIMLNPFAAVLVFVAAVLIGPIAEELAFRKTLFGLIKNQTTAIIVSSILFGVAHLTTELILGDFMGALISGLSYIAAGFAFAYVYVKSKKNIHISILVHMSYNLFSLITLFI